MSSKRARRKPAGNQNTEQRHMALLRAGNNPAILATESKTQYQQHGRGIWLTAIHGQTPTGAPLELTYIPLTRIPAGIVAELGYDDITRMARTYNPDHQAVIVINDHDAISAYKVRLIPIADPVLN